MCVYIYIYIYIYIRSTCPSIPTPPQEAERGREEAVRGAQEEPGSMYKHNNDNDNTTNNNDN